MKKQGVILLIALLAVFGTANCAFAEADAVDFIIKVGFDGSDDLDLTGNGTKYSDDDIHGGSLSIETTFAADRRGIFSAGLGITFMSPRSLKGTREHKEIVAGIFKAHKGLFKDVKNNHYPNWNTDKITNWLIEGAENPGDANDIFQNNYEDGNSIFIRDNEANFSFTPIYALLKLRYPHEVFSPYVACEFGFTFFNHEGRMFDTTGLHYGGGVGVILMKRFQLEAMFTHDQTRNDWGLFGMIDGDGILEHLTKYEKVTFSVGYIF